MSELQKTTGNNLPKKPEDMIKSLMSNESVKAKFAEILGKNANAFISSVTTIATTSALKECDPKSILSCAIAAASLNLQVNPNLGQAAIIPYYGKNSKGERVQMAQFQIMSKGIWQLALRSKEFETVNVSEVYEGQLKSRELLTGKIDLSGEKTSDKIIGYVSYFKLLTGFEKSLYMSIEEIHKHAKKFSKTYESAYGAWKTNFDGMASKTVFKLLLSRYAPLSVDMQKAIEYDQSVPKANDELDITDFEYVDSNQNGISDFSDVTDTQEVVDAKIKNLQKKAQGGAEQAVMDMK
jgi:recombination protein RecT